MAWLETHGGAFDLFINNEWTPASSGEAFESVNPSTGRVMARTAQANDELSRYYPYADDLGVQIVRMEAVAVDSPNEGQGVYTVQCFVVEAQGELVYEDFKAADPESLSREDIISKIQEAGLWPAIRQRPC